MRISRQPRRNHNQAAPAAVERLEARRLLAGTVTADFDANGILIITGDGESNQIEVHLERTVGYTITGTDTAIVTSAPGATPVPGGVFIPPLSGPLTPGNVILGGGDDIVTLSGDFAFHAFSIDTGNGNDQVFANGDYGDGPLFIKTGNGHDRVVYTAETFLLSSSIDTGNGNDVVVLDGFSPFQGTHTIATGNGDDRVEIGGTDFFLGALNVLTGTGNDAVVVSGLSAFGTNLNFDGGNGGADTFTGQGAIDAFNSALSILNFETVT